MLTTICFGRCRTSSGHRCITKESYTGYKSWLWYKIIVCNEISVIVYTSEVSPRLATLQNPTHGDVRTGHHRYQKWVLNTSSFSHLSLHSHLPNIYHLHSPSGSSVPVSISRDAHFTYTSPTPQDPHPTRNISPTRTGKNPSTSLRRVSCN
jgi:hypothetical protein